MEIDGTARDDAAPLSPRTVERGLPGSYR